jgi:hypothetical protein
MLRLARNTHNQKVALLIYAVHNRYVSSMAGTLQFLNGRLANRKFTYIDGSTYTPTPTNRSDNPRIAIGSYRQSKTTKFERNGEGTYSDKTGNVYFGTWKDDKPINVTLNGTTTIEGSWKNGEPDLTEKFIIKDQKAKTEYIGMVNSQFKQDGAGLFDYGTTTIEGFWKNGEPDLTKKFTIDDNEAKTEYTGIINSQFKPNGKGTMKQNSTTTRIEGFWENGEPDLTKDFTIFDEDKDTKYIGKVNYQFKPEGEGDFYSANGTILKSRVLINGKLVETITTPRKRDVNLLPP